MPNFPIYRGEKPEVLNPLKLHDYLLLAYWVYFRPTALNCYLNAAAPNLEKAQGLSRIFKLWRVRAYRNVYLMLPIALAIFAVLVASVVILYTFTTFQGNPSWVNAIAITPNGQLAVSATGTRDLTIQVPSVDSTLKVWDLRWGTQKHTLRGHSYGVTAVAITPDGKQAVSAARDHTLKVWDINSGKQLHTLKGHKEWVTGVAVTSDGKRAVSTAADKTLKVWDLKSGKVLHTLRGHQDTVLTVALTNDGQRAVSTSADQTLKVWDIVHGEELYTLKGHSAWVTGVALTTDGQQAVSASADQTLKVWDIAHGKELYTLKGHQCGVTHVALTPDGKAVSTSTDQTLKVWEIAQGKLLKTLTGHQGWVTNLALTPDGHRAVSASSDQTVKVWDLDKLQILHTLRGHNAWVTAIAVTSKTPRVISASFKDYPQVWDLERGKLLPMRGIVAQNIGINVSLWSVLPFAILATAVSIAVILAVGLMTFGVLGGIVSSFVPVGVISLVFCISFVMLARIAADPILNEQYRLGNTNTDLTIIFGILLGLLVGVTFGLISRPASGVFGAIAFTLILGAAVALVVICVISPAITLKGRIRPGITAFQTVGITFNYLVAFGAFRLLFYPVQLVLAFLSRYRSKWHPILWDELLVLPVPGTRTLLQARLKVSEQSGLAGVAEVLKNPFQRVFAQQALQTHLQSSPAPLHFLYFVLTNPDFNTYIVAPIATRDWQLLPTTRQVLLGELASQKVDCTSDGINYLAENLVRSLTRFGRNGKVTPLTRFAELLYQLSYTKIIETEDFNLSSYQKIYATLTEYPGGSEIADSFEAMAIFLTYQQLSDFSGAAAVVQNLLMVETPLRPSVLTALTRCGEITRNSVAFSAAVTTTEKLAILAQITRHLDKLDEYVTKQVITPEQGILKLILSQWRWIVSQAIVESEG
jgi:WD40 repeat protein